MSGNGNRRMAPRAVFCWALLAWAGLTAGLGPAVASGQVAEQPTTVPAPTATRPAEAAVPDLNVTERGIVQLHVQGVDLRKVLQLLSTQSQTNIIASKEVQGTVTADLYGVTFAEALDAVLKSAGFGHVRQGPFIYVYTLDQIAKLQAAQRQVVVKVFKLNYITASDAKTLIAPAQSADGTVSITPPAVAGIKTSKEEAGGNALGTEDVIVVKDYPENLEKITAILGEVDRRPQQVLIEATILRARLSETNALGIDFTALAGLDFSQVGAVSSPALSGLTLGALPAAQLNNATAGFANSVTGGTGGIPPGGLNIGFIYNEVAFFIRALEDITDTTVLANPKLLVLNKQRGEVLVGRRDGYLTTTVSETTTTQTVEFLETGTKLVVRPFIAGDGHVRLEIHPEDSAGGLNAAGLPFQETTECTSNVLVKDGHTIVIGGLFKESTKVNRRQIPLLGNLPIAGNLFGRRIDETERQEVIILITPHILKQPAAETVSEQLKDQVERFRIGARQGLMWWGRDRLAQASMRLAREHASEGHYGLALWDASLALSMNPSLEEAIRLKERLTKQAVWANEARCSSANYIVQMMIMQELGQPVEKVIPPDRPRNPMTLDEEIREAFGIGPRAELPLSPRRQHKPGLPGPGAASGPPGDVQAEPLPPGMALPTSRAAGESDRK